MRTNYILIDFENVHPSNLEILKEYNFKVIVFVGAKQNKISFELAAAMRSLGNNAQYLQIEGIGPNALDFHIAYYIGDISAKDENCYFHIISKDTGFDPLIQHLKNKNIYAQRVKDICDISLLKYYHVKSIPEQLSLIVDFLQSRGSMKPKTLKGLSNSVHSLFMKRLSEEELTKIIDQLTIQKLIIIEGQKVTYNLTE